MSGADEKPELILKIHDLLAEAGKQLRADFEEIKRDNPHFGERGGEAEDILRLFLNNHLPKRFAADSGIVIDERNEISRQTDVIVYDALNSPIYRRGSRVLILPSDNVAAVIEVKSRLTKRQLIDAAGKIASVKRLYKTPVSNVDQPVLRHPLVSCHPKTPISRVARRLSDASECVPTWE